MMRESAPEKGGRRKSRRGRRLRAGVVGLGIGEQHVIGYNAIEGVRVTDVCDIDPVKLRAVGARNDVPKLHTDYRKVTENPDIDVVSIASPDDQHAEQAISAFNHGKHVMVEKPIALNRRDAERLLRAQQDSKKLITSNLILRLSPRFRELKSWIDAGDFGDIVSIQGDYIHRVLWRMTKGWRGKMPFDCVTYYGGIHMIDLMRWLTGQEVTQVIGMGNDFQTRGSGYRYDDVIVNLLRFDGGTIGRSMSNLGAMRPRLHALSVYGTLQTWVNDTPHAKLFDGDQPDNWRDIDTPYPAVGKGGLLPDFIAAIRTGGQPYVTPVDVFRTMDVCFACYESTWSDSVLPVTYSI